MSIAAACRRLALPLLIPAALAGCVSLAPVPPEQEVWQRAQARWDALRAGEWAKAYGYMAPAFRAVVEEKRYASRFGPGVAWVSAEVIGVSCAEDRCVVEMKLVARPVFGARVGDAINTGVKESWVREDGQWWMFEQP